GIEAIKQNGIGGAVLLRQLQLGIADDHFAVIGNAQFGSYLQHNFHFFVCGHNTSSVLGLLAFGCNQAAERHRRPEEPGSQSGRYEVAAQCKKWRMPVKTMARPRRSAAAMT